MKRLCGAQKVVYDYSGQDSIVECSKRWRHGGRWHKAAWADEGFGRRRWQSRIRWPR